MLCPRLWLRDEERVLGRGNLGVAGRTRAPEHLPGGGPCPNPTGITYSLSLSEHLDPPFPGRLGLLITIWVSPVLPAGETGCARGKQTTIRRQVWAGRGSRQCAEARAEAGSFRTEKTSRRELGLSSKAFPLPPTPPDLPSSGSASQLSSPARPAAHHQAGGCWGSPCREASLLPSHHGRVPRVCDHWCLPGGRHTGQHLRHSGGHVW